MQITTEDLTRLALEADEAVYRLVGEPIPTRMFQSPNANGDCLPKFVPAEVNDETVRTYFRAKIRDQRCKILELDVTEASMGVLQDLLAPTRLQWGLEIRIALNFWGVPYFSFHYNGVYLFEEH